MTAVVRAAVGRNSLIHGPTFASMTVNQTPQIRYFAGQRNLQVARTASGAVAGIARYWRGRKNAANTIFSDDSGRRSPELRWRRHRMPAVRCLRIPRTFPLRSMRQSPGPRT